MRGDVFAQRVTVTLDGVRVTLVTRWSDQTGAWYVDVLDADGQAVSSGCRITPGVPIVYDVTAPGLPPGVMYAAGPDPYWRTELGGDLQVLYLGAS